MNPQDMQEPMEQEAQDSGGYEICIQCWPDGKIQVTKEPLDMQEESGESAGQECQSIDEALEIAKTMYSEEGHEEAMPAEEMTTEGNEDADPNAFASGFGSVRGNGLNR